MVNSQLKTLETIGAILSFKSDPHLLKITLQKEHFNWDALVTIGSRHLVLPAMYCRLKEKQLLHCLPEDLVLYLEEITAINRNRNLGILKEVTAISELFNKHQIDHVFLKGSALLAGNYYQDIGERMIGDIDVLVASNQLDEAYELLLKEDYKSNVSFGDKYFEYQHLPRLAKKTVLAAVEIHRNVLKRKYFNCLIVNEIFIKKRIINGISIPNDQHLFEHNILNLQLNDQGNYLVFVNLRTAYDTELILKENSTIDFNFYYSKGLFKNYFLLHPFLIKDFNNIPSTTITNKLYLAFYIFKTKHRWFNIIWNKIFFFVDLVTFLVAHFWFFISNKKYRTDLIKERKHFYKKLKIQFFR
ncbi:Uncharacterised nucleotidyltransferase [Lutibacter agarilyticus]|uniref:Uncharacterized nucleotidyltransferase n=1 Tax=Lutibacter agarilyticus TaxID=1109740 RepID=A0A238YTN7_9FLAO|nr:nucleotidyltransferase family protein [Lutibacter agarilyticus]SNR74515.1 Uncharacterised nucleotidyltransferase [Lutibacter agarilyticus]